ncbi:MAG: hypothetical protein ACI9R3_003288 [Verrucomicrobiales bacterium]|jgi:hypothetical protein
MSAVRWNRELRCLTDISAFVNQKAIAGLFAVRLSPLAFSFISYASENPKVTEIMVTVVLQSKLKTCLLPVLPGFAMHEVLRHG